MTGQEPHFGQIKFQMGIFTCEWRFTEGASAGGWRSEERSTLSYECEGGRRSGARSAERMGKAVRECTEKKEIQWPVSLEHSIEKKGEYLLRR